MTALLKSRTVWGLMLTALSIVLSKYGIDLNAELQSQAADVIVGVIGAVGVGLTATGPAVQSVAASAAVADAKEENQPHGA